MGTTYVSNCYMTNYFFSRDGAGCWCPYATYSNCTLERVYNIVIDTTGGNNTAMSGCLIKDCGFNDIKEYLEGQGLEPYNHDDRYWDHSQKKWIFPDSGYMIKSSLTGDKRAGSNAWDGNIITLFPFNSGSAITQNKIVCDDFENTRLIKIGSEVHLVSFDDHNQCVFSIPSLSSVHQPTREEGRRAVEKLINMIFGKKENDETIKPYLMVRESSGGNRPEPGIRASETIIY